MNGYFIGYMKHKNRSAKHKRKFMRTPFTWYSSTKGVGKIGEYDIGRIFRLCKYMDDLISKKDRLANSTSKRKKK